MPESIWTAEARKLILEGCSQKFLQMNIIHQTNFALAISSMVMMQASLCKSLLAAVKLLKCLLCQPLATRIVIFLVLHQQYLTI